MKKKIFFLTFLILILAIIFNTNLKHHIYTLIQAAKQAGVSHYDYLIFPNISLKGNKNLKSFKKNLIKFDKKKYDFTKFKVETLMVMKNDEIVIEEYYNNHTKNDKFNLFSSTKTIISLAIGILQDRGKLNINEKVVKYLPNWNFNETTIKNVLEMSSGFAQPLINWYLDMGFDYFAYNLTDRIYSYRKNTKEKPGKYFRYSNLNTQILSEIIKKVTSMESYKFIEENLYKKIAKNDAIWSMDRTNNIKAFCCLYLNTEDFMRFGKFVKDKGKIGNEQILSENYINSIYSPNENMLENKNSNVKNNFYGLHSWVLYYEGIKVKYFHGILNQISIIIDDWDLLITSFGNDPDSGERINMEKTVKNIIKYVKEILKIK